MILLDTSVLSLAFRRRRRDQPGHRAVQALRQMIRADVPLAVPGIVLQELLSGVRGETQFVFLKDLLEAFPILVAEQRDHVAAARIANACRRRGIAASAVDFLISALATTREAPLFTLDEDFRRMAPHCGLKLFDVIDHAGP